MNAPSTEQTAADLAAIDAEGWVVIPQLLPPALLEKMRAALAPHLARERLGRTMSPRVQALLGYSIHPPFMGHVRGLHPRRLLEPEKRG